MGIHSLLNLLKREPRKMLSEGEKNLTKFGRRHNFMLTCISSAPTKEEANLKDLKVDLEGEVPNQKIPVDLEGEVPNQKIPKASATDAITDQMKGLSDALKGEGGFEGLENMDMKQMLDIMSNAGGEIPDFGDMQKLINDISEEEWAQIAKPDLGLSQEELNKALEEIKDPNLSEEQMEELRDMFEPFISGDGIEFDNDLLANIAENPTLENFKKLPPKFMEDVIGLTEKLSDEKAQKLFEPIIDGIQNEELKKLFHDGFGNLRQLNELVQAQHQLAQEQPEQEQDGSAKIVDGESSDESSEEEEDENELNRDGRMGSIEDNEKAGEAKDDDEAALKLFE